MSISEECIDPFEGFASNSMKNKLVQESHVRDFIKRFEKIQEKYIHLVFLRTKLVDDTMEGCNELGLVGSTFPKSMLNVAEDTIGFEMAHDAAVYNIFKDLACYY